MLIDKNVVQGFSQADFAALGERYTLLMPDVLFFEMLSTPDPRERAQYFGKLPRRDNPIVMVDHIGAHLQEELTLHRPSARPSAHPLPMPYRFHPRLRDPAFVLPDEVQAKIAEHRRALARRRIRMVERALLMGAIVQQRMQRERENQPQAIAVLRVQATSLAGARDLLAHVAAVPDKELTMPALETLDTSWALVRHTQTMAVFSLDLFSRQGSNLRDDAYLARRAGDLDHDALDFEYLALAVHEGAFATRERKLRALFRELRPDGLLLPEDS